MITGRPLKFATVAILQKEIDAYFKDTKKEEWTITGLAMALDTYRDVLIDYQNGKYDEEDRDFSNAVKKAKLKVENGYEIDLKKYGRSGTIFALKNFNWKDRVEQDVTSGGEKVSIQGFIYQPANELINDHVQQSDEEAGKES
jgi:hypothetical protein